MTRRETVAAAAGYLLATLVMTWPFVNYLAGGRGSYGSDQWLIVWTLAWTQHALFGPDALFSSNIFFPAADSLRYNEHLFSLGVLALPLRWLGASPVVAHNILWALAFPLNALAGFALARRFTPRAAAAWLGGLVFAFSFYVMLHAGGHLHLLWLWPIPLSLLLLERWFDAPSPARIAAWTLVVLFEALTSWYMAVMVLLASAVGGLVLLATGAREPDRAALWRTRARHLAAAAAVLAVCVWPFARHYVGIESAPGEATTNAATLADYLVPPENTVVGRWWETTVDDRPGEIFGERTVFLGWTSLALSAVGLIALGRRGRHAGRAWLLPALAATGLLVGFGPALPGLGETVLAPFAWLTALPGLDGLRAPARFAALGTLGLAGLAALGAAAIADRWRGRASLAVLAFAPLLLGEVFVVDFPAGKPQVYAVPAIYRAPELADARALVSLPEYRGQDDWFLGADYLYYATVHWRPIVNGFGRTEPPGHGDRVALARAFPASAPALAALGVEYVVVHAARYGDGGARVLDAVDGCATCTLVRREGDDYLFAIAPGPG